jgi:hypothetical protein
MGVYIAPTSPDCHESDGIRRAALVAPGEQPAVLGGAEMNDESVIVSVAVPARLRLDTELGRQRAWRNIPYKLRRKYIGPYNIIESVPLDSNTNIVSIRLTRQGGQ